MPKMKASQSDETGKTVAYVVLGIVGVMAIVALVLLFNNARATGQSIIYVTDTAGAYSAADRNFDTVSGYRVGEAAEPLAWADRVANAAAGGAEAQR